MVKVAAVVLNWNGKKDTLECVESLKKADLKNIDLNLIIVDNNSTDDSVMALRKLKFKFKYKIIINNDNLGFAGGNNVGIKEATENQNDYILILNNDTVIEKNMIQAFVNFMEKNDKVGVATGKIYFFPGFEFHKETLGPDGPKKRYKESELGKIIWSAGGDIDWNNVYGVNHGVDEVDNGQFDNITATDFATGACSFFRTKAIKKVGGYDERYFAYLEDLELSERMKRKKWEIKYIPDAILWHKVSQSSSIGSNLNDYFITRNRMIFGMKYAGLRAKFALLRESIKFLVSGREWQKIGIIDYYLGNLYKGSWGK